MSTSPLRWIPATAAIIVVAAGAVAVPLAANAAVSLSPKSPQQVLAMIASSTEDTYSGKLATTSNLGLPSLPSIAGTPSAGSSSASDVSSLLTLLSSPQSARVYVDGTSRERVQVLTSMAEQDVIRNGADVWQYDSTTNAVTHSTLPTRKAKTPTTTITPAELAKKLVAELKKSSTLAVGTSARVAGRDSYTLELKPTAKDSLVGSAAISVDSATGLPLAVSVTARGSHDPAFALAFTSIDLSTPSASLFDFTPPKGAKVTEQKAQAPVHSRPTGPATGDGAAKPAVVGSGWDAVVVTPASPETAKLASQKLFAELTTAVKGGRVFHTTIANVLVTTDGRVVAGSVSIDRLLAVAAQ